MPQRMIESLIRLILHEQTRARRTGNRLLAVYIGQDEARKMRSEIHGMSGWIKKVHREHTENEPDFIICQCPVFVLERVKNHIGICIQPE